MCEEAEILNRWGSLVRDREHTHIGRWRYRVGMADKAVVQGVADWGTRRIRLHRLSSGEMGWDHNLHGPNLLRFLEYYEPCMEYGPRHDRVIDALYDLRQKYGVAV